MKKAIFLVEQFEGNRPMTFLECLYKKLDDKIRRENNYSLSWLPEIVNILNDPRFNDIKFVAVRDFIKQVEVAGAISDDYEVYYLISCFHNLENFHRSYFLAMDPEVTDFLVKHKIPIILDASFETNHNYYQNSYNMFEAGIFTRNDSINDHGAMYYRNLRELEFYVIGNLWYKQNEYKDRRTVKIYHGVFSGPFFHHYSPGAPVRKQLEKDLEQRLEIISNREFKEDTLIWQAFANTPRMTRALFQMFADSYQHGNFKKVGRYSRLNPMKETFLREVKDCDLFNFEGDKLAEFVSEEKINSLDDIIILDVNKIDNLNLFKTDLDAMIWIVLECAYMHDIKEVSNSVSEVTEKCMQPIINGHAFIPLGGQHIGTILQSYGFKEFPELEFATNPNFLKELTHVVEHVWRICIKTHNERRDLFESWKEIAKYNLINYTTLNPQRLYLDMLHETKLRGE